MHMVYGVIAAVIVVLAVIGLLVLIGSIVAGVAG